MFHRIKNPETGRWVNIKGKKGIQILKNYMIKTGGSSSTGREQCIARPRIIAPYKDPDHKNPKERLLKSLSSDDRLKNRLIGDLLLELLNLVTIAMPFEMSECETILRYQTKIEKLETKYLKIINKKKSRRSEPESNDKLISFINEFIETTKKITDYLLGRLIDKSPRTIEDKENIEKIHDLQWYIK